MICQVNVPRLGMEEIEVRIVKGIDFIVPGKSGVVAFVQYELTILEEKATGTTGMLVCYACSTVCMNDPIEGS